MVLYGTMILYRKVWNLLSFVWKIIDFRTLIGKLYVYGSLVLV